MMNGKMESSRKRNYGLMKLTDAMLLQMSRAEVRTLEGYRDDYLKLVAKNNLLLAQVEELTARVEELEAEHEQVRQDVRNSSAFQSIKNAHRKQLERNRKQKNTINELLVQLNRLNSQTENAA